MNQNDKYMSPFSERYASKEMQYLFSANKKYSTWRRLWVALAETEKELGIKQITDEMIKEMKSHIEDIDYELANKYEEKLRHDVMAHIHAYGDQCPTAKGIIHLGATSCYVGDNADIIIMKEALLLLKKKLVNLINNLANFALKYKDVPTLAYTHFQAAQPTTVGKRASLWLHDFIIDLEDLEYVVNSLKLLGNKGTTGTQASFVELFNDKEAPIKLDKLIANKMGFKDTYPVSGQTYTRKIDCRIYNVLTSIATSASKMANDIRLLQHEKEIEEPFESSQVGSSAMPYKRNPMRSERITSIARYVISNMNNPYITASSQWLERTLDDSANRRIVLSEGFLGADGILDLCINITEGLVVNQKVIEKNLKEELPFMITENILMDQVKEGGNRQELHEEIRKLSMEASKRVKEEGLDNDLYSRILASNKFKISNDKDYLNPNKYIGLANEQVTSFINAIVNPILEKNKDLLGIKVKINK